jgi:Raf kinase inhibitor-like YbhB/YbcL family protein
MAQRTQKTERTDIMLDKIPREIGEAIKGARPGLGALTFNDDGLEDVDVEILITSPAFAAGGAIPIKYTADGEGISPPLEWSGVPEGISTLLLLIEDADSPTPEPFVHAIVYNLPGGGKGLDEGALPSEKHQARGVSMGRNTLLKTQYLPPDPPPGHGIHRYAFQIYALATRPAFAAPPGRAEVREALREYAVAKGILLGTFERR